MEKSITRELSYCINEYLNNNVTYIDEIAKTASLQEISYMKSQYNLLFGDNCVLLPLLYRRLCKCSKKQLYLFHKYGDNGCQLFLIANCLVVYRMKLDNHFTVYFNTLIKLFE